MEKRLTVLDERNIWHGPMIAAARARGYEAQRIERGYECDPEGLGFIRPHAVPRILEQNVLDFVTMRERVTMVQDLAQMEVYEDKSAQFWRWREFMPLTWRFENKNEACDFINSYKGPLVSKADVGASSYNVRVLHTTGGQLNHAQAIFSRGVPVNHCAGGPGGRKVTSIQRGYILLQEWIPHEITWRVNVIGRGCHAIFKRYNAPGTETCQTGNVEGVVELDEAALGAAAKALQIADAVGSKWIAIDLLRKPNGRFYMLETSLAWPWPSPGNCMEAQFFGPTTRKWAGIWDLMLDEYEAGAWSSAS